MKRSPLPEFEICDWKMTNESEFSVTDFKFQERGPFHLSFNIFNVSPFVTGGLCYKTFDAHDLFISIVS